MTRAAAVHAPANGTRTLWIRVLTGLILLIVGGALTFFFDHTQLDAHHGAAKDIGSLKGDMTAVKKDVKANRESLIRIETKLQTTPVGPTELP